MVDILGLVSKYARATILVGAIVLHPIALGQELDLNAIEAQINAGKAEQAYQALLTREDDLAGDVDYDYLLGVAALESGRPNDATFAFERVLTVEPNFLDARLDMARAYFEIGSLELAKQQLQVLQAAADLSTDSRSAVERYLATIERRQDKTDIRFYLTGGGGYDTNANEAIGTTAVFIPALNSTVTLDRSDAATNDAFMAVAGGAELSHEITDQLKFRLSGRVKYLEYLSTDGNESTQYGVLTGLDYVVGADKYTVEAVLRHEELDWDPYQTVWGLSGIWEHTFNERAAGTVFAAHTRLRYSQSDDEGNDSNLSIVGVRAVHVLGETGATVLSGSLYAGVDTERNLRSDGTSVLGGTALQVQHRFMSGLTAGLRGGLQRSVYDRENPLFQVGRVDTLIDVAATAEWQALPKLKVKPLIGFRRNISNTDLNDSKRLIGEISVRWDF
jgi:outer membrane protein